jgi:hypothetical protein
VCAAPCRIVHRGGKRDDFAGIEWTNTVQAYAKKCLAGPVKNEFTDDERISRSFTYEKNH